jgi:hypothetical protein
MEFGRLLPQRAMPDLSVPKANHALKELGETNRDTRPRLTIQDISQRRIEAGETRTVVPGAAKELVADRLEARVGTSSRTNSHQCPSDGRARFVRRSASSGACSERSEYVTTATDPNSFSAASQRQ